jgi:N-acetylglucosamine kinase-like BadF-type ATPase
VAAGTGTVCVARGPRRWAKVDGWGSLLGDAGSGFAIGRAGLDAALRHVDGRGGSAVLLKAAERRFGPAPALVERIHAAPVPTRAVASFAADVAREAAAGDGVAAAILREADRVAAGAGAETIALHAQTYTQALYEQAGYREYGPTFVEEGIEHVAMEKRLA